MELIAQMIRAEDVAERARIGIVAIGEKGCVLLNAVAETLHFLDSSVAIDSNTEILNGLSAGRKIALRTEGEIPYNVEDIRLLAKSALPEISDAIANLHLVFIIADMADRVGRWVAPVVAGSLVEKNILSIAVVTALGDVDCMRELQSHGIAIMPLSAILLESTRAGEVMAVKESIAFRKLWNGLVLSLCGPSSHNVDFEDLRQILCQPGRCIAGFGAGGDVASAIDAALFSIRSSRGGLLQHASSVLMSVGGNWRDLEIAHDMVAYFRGNFSRDTMTCYGDYFSDRFGGNLSVLILACGLRCDGDVEACSN